MKQLFSLIIFLNAALGFAQSNELVFLKGKVISTVKELKEVNVYNLRSESATATDENGNYSMFVKVGDTLQFQSLQIATKKLVVSEIDVKKTLLVTQLLPKVIALEEVEIQDHSNINAVSLRILDKPAKKYTPAERRLKTATDIDATASVGMMAGGSIGLDPILNAISGRTAMLKKELEVERQERLMIKVENQFKPEYFTNRLKIPEEYVKGFLYYIADDAKLGEYMNKKNKGMAKFRLSELASQYLTLLKNSNQ
ncbi:hypothetical protein [Flavobacterium sp.]|jgi:hypothetical protein|uniref:hypothetical protein n=1 Tax=Flavobacterium sp. TaxID=239 RepID=UPI0037C0B1B0